MFSRQAFTQKRDLTCGDAMTKMAAGGNNRLKAAV
jgi:hypothetical protein